MVKYTVNERAYALPLLHAAKYPSSEVCGILLADASSSDSETVNITKAVPLFHHWTTLTPMLEVALQQVNVMRRKDMLMVPDMLF
jgi:ER membrane protein complex subunit 8/9